MSVTHSNEKDMVHDMVLFDHKTGISYFIFFFVDLTGRKNMIPNTETVPVALTKMKQFGLKNVIFEVDISGGYVDFEKFPLQNYFALLEKWIVWAHENLDKHSKVFVNIRDLNDTMPSFSNRCFELVDYLAQLPNGIRPFGVMFEEPGGGVLPEECGKWSAYIRKMMNVNKWNPHLLVHVHEKFGFADSSTLHVRIVGEYKSLVCDEMVH